MPASSAKAAAHPEHDETGKGGTSVGSLWAARLQYIVLIYGKSRVPTHRPLTECDILGEKTDRFMEIEGNNYAVLPKVLPAL